jgi:hypothetical protein
MARGGKREGAGRKKLERVTNADVATRVLAKAKAEQLWLSMIALERKRLGIGEDGKIDKDAAKWNTSIQPLTSLLHYLEDRAYGRTVQQIRVANPEGEKFQVEVDVTSARAKLLAALAG